MELLDALFMMELLMAMIPPTQAEIDADWVRNWKGQKFTVLGPAKGNVVDNSYIGDIFEVVTATGIGTGKELIVGKRICEDNGQPPYSHSSSNVTISTARYLTQPVTEAYVRALRGQ